MVNEAHDFILIILPREEALLRSVIHALFIGTSHAHNGLSAAQVLIRLEGHVTEEDSDVLPLDHSIVVKIVPASHTSIMNRGNRFEDCNSAKRNFSNKDTYILKVRRILSSKLLR